MRRINRQRRWVAPGAALTLAVAACGGGASGPDEANGNGGTEPDEATCPLEALDEAAADGPVEITFWHAMSDLNKETLEGLVEDFEASQDQVTVDLVHQPGYRDAQDAYASNLGTGGELPDLVQHQETFLGRMVDTGTALPVQACIDAEDYDLSDFVPRTINYYNLDGTQWALPFNVNTQVFIYNKLAFEDAGLDPDDPPDSLEELRDAAQALTDSGYPAGLGLKRDGHLLEYFMALRGLPLVDNGNGREDRASQVLLEETPDAEEILGFFNDMVEDGLAVTNPTEGQSQNDNLLGLGGDDPSHAMTFTSSGSLGIAASLLADEQFPDVEAGVAPMPGSTDDGGALIGGAGLYISAEDPAQQAAAWELMKFLATPESQATWAAQTGFIPVRQSSLDIGELQDAWAETPFLRVAYDQLLAGAENEATAGPVLGTYRSYRDDAEEMLRQVFESELSPTEGLANLTETSNDDIEQYNEDIDI